MARAYLGLGSNQGDRVTLVNAALERLEASGRVRVIKRSSFYETAPVGVTDQPRFVNLVSEGHTDLDPQDLLELALAVDRTLGRVRRERWRVGAAWRVQPVRRCGVRVTARRWGWRACRGFYATATSIRTAGATPVSRRSSSFEDGTAVRWGSAWRASMSSRPSATSCLP